MDSPKETTMRYRLLGKSGLRVSELCLGTMTFGEDWGWGASKEESGKVFNKFVEAGGNFIDTANYYTNGTSERIVGELVRDRRAEFVLATKYTLSTRPTDPNGGGNHRKNLVQALEASLRRLGTDYIDLYWLHAWDFMTPVEEVMHALNDAVRAGKILYVGISDTPAWIVSQANTLAEFRGWTPFIGLQIPYSLVERAPERDLLPMARAFDMAVTTWGAVGGGVLTGKYKKGQPHPQGHRLSETGSWGAKSLSDHNLTVAAVVERVAKDLGKTASQVAIAWVLAQHKRANIIPILGARRLAQIEDNLGALDFQLPQAAYAQLEEASRIELGFPHEFLTEARRLIFGETFDRIHNHRA
jgi:aryl-alcohol dehydrogenase-like predicted oxidoreductase